jgi:hypothetical protein
LEFSSAVRWILISDDSCVWSVVGGKGYFLLRILAKNLIETDWSLPTIRYVAIFTYLNYSDLETVI